MRIIRATLDDLPRIMDCAREFTSIIPDCPLHETHYLASWREFLSSNSGVIFLIENDGEVVGGIGGVSHPDLLTGRKIAVELFWYVKEAFRTGTHPIRLLHEFESWAQAIGCTQVNMIHMECSMPESMKSIYERQGYELFETIYRKAIP